MANFKYFFEVTRKGDPIPGSNIKTRRPPRASGKRWKEFLPQAVACCDDGFLEQSFGRKDRYYVRLDAYNLPVSGSLMKRQHPPTGFAWQEVVGLYCCAPTVDTQELVINTSDSPYTGNVINLLNATDPNGDTLTLVETGTITGDGMDLEIENTQDGDVTITQDNDAVGTSYTFTLTLTDGLNQVPFHVTVNYTP